MITEIFGYSIPALPLDTRAGVLLLAMLIEWFIPFPFFVRLNKLVAPLSALGRRVNRLDNSPSQKSFAGFFLPLIIIIVVFTFLIALRVLLEGIPYISDIIDFCILLILLESRPERALAKTITKYLKEDKKEEARKLLGRYTLRVTKNLSPLGISKAATESSVLRLINHFFMPAFVYLALGIEAAMFVKIFVILAMAFNLKLPINQYFGKFSSTIEQICFILPTIWMIIVINFFPGNRVNDPKALAYAINSWPSKTSAMILAVIASKINVKLGGPRYYMLALYRYPVIGGTNEPDLETPKKALALTSKAIWVSIGIIMACCFGYEYYSFYH